MKRILLSALLAVGGWQTLGAAPWINEGSITSVPIIDNSTFVNRGSIDILTYDSLFTATPFETRNTLYYLNDGIMTSSDGFRFDKRTDTQRLPSVSFVNNSIITAVDGPLLLNYSRNTGNGSHPIPGAAPATPSYLLVSAGAITNRGLLTVGGVGLLALTGNSIDLERSVQTAGEPDLYTYNSYGVSFGYGDAYRGFTYTNLYVNPVGVRDLFWGSGGANFDLGGIVRSNALGGYTVNTPPVDTKRRQSTGTYKESLPITYNYSYYNATNYSYTNYYSYGPQFAAYVYTNLDLGGSNTYVNVVLVNTNFLDTNIVADVRFTSSFYGLWRGGWRIDAYQSVVQFGVPSLDVATGLTITNAFYLMDRGGVIPTMGNMVNYESPNGYSRPEAFEITTGTPMEWLSSYPTNASFDASMIAPGHTYTAQKVDAQYSIYGAQVGRNPEIQSGVTMGTNYGYYFSSYGSPLFKDPTNEAPRIEINATDLNLTDASIRSEGMVSLKAKKIKGLDKVAIDAGFIDCDFTAASSLVISNVIPSHFRRCRGDVYAWSANWTSVQTNDVATNTFYYHVLVVDHSLKADFRPATPSIAFRAPRVDVQDPLTMYHKCYFQTENLTLNSPVTLAGDLTSFTVANLPKLKTFLNDTNGQLSARSQINLGMDTTAGLSSFTNRGSIASTVVSIKTGCFENSGTIEAVSGGNMYIQANSMVLTSNTSTANYYGNYAYSGVSSLSSFGALQISSGTLKANNSILVAGRGGHGALKLSVPTKLTDLTPGVPSTNSVLNSYWGLYNGLVMNTKPTYGDLFGTEVISIGTGNNYNTHIWPGVDRGSNVCGFTNNLVIGRLVLDKISTKSTLYFKGAGTKNAMYVDYLDFQDLATNFLDNIIIDNNLTIYFAGCNFPPDKVQKRGLVWVPDFAGPNSSTLVPVHIGGVLTNLWLNQALAQSAFIDSNGDGNPNKTDLFPFDGLFLSVNVSGQGSVTPDLTSKPLVLGRKYTFTATPAYGYLFAGWTGETNSKCSTISLAMVSNMVLNANFVPDNLCNAKGTYKGLYLAATNINFTNSGAFTFTLNEKGTGSGVFGTNTFTPIFAQDGSGTATIKRINETITLKMQLDFSNATDTVVGTATGKGWTASLLGNRSVFGLNNPASAMGLYTMVFLGGTNAAITPSGSGYATITVSNTGITTFVGKLADNFAITRTAPISKYGSLPFYVGADGKEMIIGWLNFDTNDLSSITGNLTWVKKANYGTFYKNAFSMNVEVVGSRYIAPTNGQSVLDITVPVFKASEGNLTQPVTNFPSYTPKTFTYSTNKMSLVIAPTKGNFSGKFVNTLGKTNLMSGVVLQKQNAASGFFLGTSQSGEVLLSE